MSLRNYIERLEKSNELIQVSRYTSPDEIITEITDRISKQEGGGKAILFKNTGTEFPVLTNMMGSHSRICQVLGVNDLNDVGQKMDTFFSTLQERPESFLDKLKKLKVLIDASGWMPKSLKQRGKCQEIIMESPDLGKLPILKCWPADGGPFITFPLVVTQDPQTKVRNVGMYRMQVYDNQTTGMHWHRHKTGAKHYQKYKELGQQMPVSVVLGGDPVYTYSATAPLPENIDEFMFAGFLRGKGVKMVKCITNDLEVPEDADFVIEGYVDPSEELKWEGPFGDHTGFYSLADFYPVFHVTCITHRKDAIYPATIVGVPPQEDAYIAKATERIFLYPMRLGLVPEIKDIDLPVAGTAHNVAIVSIQKDYPGQAFKVMSSLWGAGQMMFNKVLIVCDEKTEVSNYIELAKLLTTLDLKKNVIFSQGPLDVLDHASSVFSFGGKLGIDFTTPLPEEANVKNNPLNRVGEFDFGTLKTINLVKEVSTHLIEQGIPILFLASEAKTAKDRYSLAQQIASLNTGLKIISIFEENIDITDISTSVWLLLGNIEIERDVHVFNNQEGGVLYFDSARKNKGNDKFNRLWPNVVCSSNEIINQVDSIWDTLEIGKFISSPSHKYRLLNDGNGAVANK